MCGGPATCHSWSLMSVLLRPLPSAPFQYPDAGVYWNAIDTVFNVPGQFTPPIATFIYLFARKNYVASGVNGKSAKRFILYAISKAGGVASRLGYALVPPNLTSQNLAAASGIVTV